MKFIAQQPIQDPVCVIEMGMRFIHHGDEFMLVCIETDQFCLVGVESGNRWTDGTKTLEQIAAQLNKEGFKKK